MQDFEDNLPLDGAVLVDGKPGYKYRGYLTGKPNECAVSGPPTGATNWVDRGRITPEVITGRTLVYEYAGFRYNVADLGGSNVTMTPCPGQHPAANKDKHRRAAREMYIEGRGK